jgi:hypothetical protein
MKGIGKVIGTILTIVFAWIVIPLGFILVVGLLGRFLGIWGAMLGFVLIVFGIPYLIGKGGDDDGGPYIPTQDAGGL